MYIYIHINIYIYIYIYIYIFTLLQQIYDCHATVQFAPCTVFPVYSNEFLCLHHISIMQTNKIA